MLDFIKQDKDPETGKVMRKVRSFVLREGRLTTGQRNALDTLWPTFGLERDQGMLDPQAVFGRDADRVLEIGYGMGQSLAAMAKADPDKDFIGIEVHRPGVAPCCQIGSGLNNLRSYCDDAVEILELCIPDNSLAQVQLPDPWHKKSTTSAASFSPPGWHWYNANCNPAVFCTWPRTGNYSEHMMEVMNTAEGFNNVAGPGVFSPRPSWRPETKFERRGEKLGHGVWDLLFKKSA